MSHAQLSNYRQSPRKVRLIADLVRGKKVSHVLPMLDLLGKRAALPVKKLIQSAGANAVHNDGLDKDTLFIEEIRVDEGFTLKRHRARARGRAFPIRKRTSHVFVRLAEFVEPVIQNIEKVVESTTKDSDTSEKKAEKKSDTNKTK